MIYSIEVDKNKFDIVDQDIVIKIKTTTRNACNICSKLNMGSGFDGNTPTFFQKSYGKWSKR
jgi:hypothetical protein